MHAFFITGKLAEAQSRVDRLSREAEAAGDRLRDLERAKDALAVELMTVRDRARTERDEKLEAEVARLREQSAKELADIRVSGREVFERENQALRESRKDALQVRIPRGIRRLANNFVYCFCAILFPLFIRMLYVILQVVVKLYNRKPHLRLALSEVESVIFSLLSCKDFIGVSWYDIYRRVEGDFMHSFLVMTSVVSFSTLSFSVMLTKSNCRCLIRCYYFLRYSTATFDTEEVTSRFSFGDAPSGFPKNGRRTKY